MEKLSRIEMATTVPADGLASRVKELNKSLAARNRVINRERRKSKLFVTALKAIIKCESKTDNDITHIANSTLTSCELIGSE